MQKFLGTMHRGSSHIVSDAPIFDPGHRIVSFYDDASVRTGESSHPYNPPINSAVRWNMLNKSVGTVTKMWKMF